MNLDELVPGATVRFTVKNGTQYISIRDLIMLVCEKDRNQAGEVWKAEVQDLNHKFPGSKGATCHHFPWLHQAHDVASW